MPHRRPHLALSLLLAACGATSTTIAPQPPRVTAADPAPAAPTVAEVPAAAEVLAPPVATAPVATAPTPPEGMVFVPGGTFTMGSDDSPDEHARPAHQVTVSPFFLDRTEVTAEAFARCEAAGACNRERFLSPEDDVALCGTGNRPITCVTWYEAVAYCRFVGGRLPTEAEWEFAARGTDGRIYPWGNEPPDATRLHVGTPLPRRVYLDHWEAEEVQRQHSLDNVAGEVGSFPLDASPFGALDMAGSALEWVQDWFGPYSGEPQVDPQGPPTGSYRIMRGGASFYVAHDLFRSDGRFSRRPDSGGYMNGFRCAQSIPR